MTDWVDMYNLGDGNVQVRYTLRRLAVDRRLRAKQYREQSPITYARDIKTPTLILSTTGDARVPITQSYQLYHALKDNDVPVKFVAYPVARPLPRRPGAAEGRVPPLGGWLDEQMH